jgi:hypothetical protein
VNKKALGVVIAALAVVGLSACEEGAPAPKTERQQVEEQASERAGVYIPQNDVEFNNYNKAQELYDNPSSIIWCTTTWGNASAPLVTVPVAGKLTSSSVSYFPNQEKVTADLGEWNGDMLVEARSVDGMYHGSPGPYRFGFTPGGQYVDFTNMPTFCTTALTEFQRQSTEVSISNDDVSATIQEQAETALQSGDADEAQRLLEQITEGDE